MHTRCCDFFCSTSVYCIIHSYSPFPFCSVLFVFVDCSFPFICLRISWKTDYYRLKEHSYIKRKRKESGSRD